MAITLSAGLFTSHVFIPLTPGPIASASNLGLEDNLLLVIGLGMLVSIPVLIVSYFFSVYIGKKITTPESEVIPDQDVEAAYEELRNSYTRLPSTLTSVRSEERRVGKEWRFGWATIQCNDKSDKTT